MVVSSGCQEDRSQHECNHGMREEELDPDQLILQSTCGRQTSEQTKDISSHFIGGDLTSALDYHDEESEKQHQLFQMKPQEGPPLMNR